VNGSKSSSSIEVVLCRFQLPLSGVNNSNVSFKVSDEIFFMIILNIYLAAMEERLGFINLDRIQAIIDKVESK